MLVRYRLKVYECHAINSLICLLPDMEDAIIPKFGSLFKVVSSLRVKF